MVSDLREVEHQKQALLKRHPELKDFHVVPLCDSGLSYQNLSDFIERCWRHDYGDQARIVFSAESLAYNIPNLQTERISSAARIDGRLTGLVLGIGTDFTFDGKMIRAFIGTGLSTDPNSRARGISQLLWLNSIEQFLENHASLGFTWLDIRHAWAGSSYSTYGGDPSKVHYKRIVSFYTKAIDPEKTAAIGKLSGLERLGIRTATRLFPPKMDLPRHFEMENGSRDDARDYADFIHEFQSKIDIKRYFSEEELARRISFAQGRVNGVALAFRGGGGVTCRRCSMALPTR